jgi:hypothetical protein
MRRIAAALAAMWDWLRSWFVRPARPLKTLRAEEMPERLDPKAVYILGEREHVWFVAMVCPCGCKATLQMSLLPDAKPRWRLVEHDDGTISLQPSVWRKVGCRSHFYLRRGLIQWCAELRS